jgi:hypothetical protein
MVVQMPLMVHCVFRLAERVPDATERSIESFLVSTADAWR